MSRTMSRRQRAARGDRIDILQPVDWKPLESVQASTPPPPEAQPPPTNSPPAETPAQHQHHRRWHSYAFGAGGPYNVEGRRQSMPQQWYRL